MKKIEGDGARIVYRRGERSAWWLVFAMPAGMVILYLLGGRDLMPYVVLAFAGAVMFIPAAFNEHVVIDTHARAIISSETFIGRTTRNETIPFSKVMRIAVMPGYASEPGKRRARRDGFALRLDWATASGDGGIVLGTFPEDAEVMGEAEKLARTLGTRVERVGL